MWTSSQLTARDGGLARLVIRQPLTANIAIHLAYLATDAVHRIQWWTILVRRLFPRAQVAKAEAAQAEVEAEAEDF